MQTPRSNIDATRFRANALSRIRDFFSTRKVLEVETPLLSRGVSHDCHIEPFSVPVDSEKAPRYLQTSPEPHMKRLLARGYPDIFQICKAFRIEEEGRLHNPEFTMIEWYRKGFSLRKMMEEAVELCRLVAGPLPVTFVSYREAFLKATGFDPLSTQREELLEHSAIAKHGLKGEDFSEGGDLLNFLMSEVVEPGFDPGALTVVHGFPLTLSSQALPDREQPDTSLRFEIYAGGMELGNGYQELEDPKEYRQRFESERKKRQKMKKKAFQVDESFFSDLEAGLPSCSGVAVGLDRLVLLGTGVKDLGSMLEFPWKYA